MSNIIPRKMIASIFTFYRIILSLIMIFFPVFSMEFYVCYLMAGITDILDGLIARKLGSVSGFGEKLDTIADIIFVIAALYKLLPAAHINMTIWIWTGIIAAIKIMNMFSGFIFQNKFVVVHSCVNKITGLVLFVLPFSLHLIDIKYSAIAVCLLATFAAIQEGHIIRNRV